MTRTFVALAVLGVTIAASACSASDRTEHRSEDRLKVDRGDHPWIYAGRLPALERPAVFISLDGHTARVTGLLPEGHDAETLPFYATSTDDGDRKRVTVVYPVATGAETNAPGEYEGVSAVGFTPSEDGVAWGGFPFLAYHFRRGIAMHGPITARDSEWRLLRGPVSHGCNRMQGEHVVEVAHLIGLDMRQPASSSAVELDDVKVTVVGYDPRREEIGEPRWDRVGDKYVDVDYPVQSGVRRPPAAESTLYPTWDSRDFPRIVCAFDEDMQLGPNACDGMPQNKKDLRTGQAL